MITYVFGRQGVLMYLTYS